MPVGIDEREPGRDKAHVVPDPRLLQKARLVGAVAEGTGQVLYQDAIDFPAIDVFQQLPEAGALVLARPADAVVNIDFMELQVLMAGNVIEQPPALIGDAVALVVPVFAGKPQVDSRRPFRRRFQILFFRISPGHNASPLPRAAARPNTRPAVQGSPCAR